MIDNALLLLPGSRHTAHSGEKRLRKHAFIGRRSPLRLRSISVLLAGCGSVLGWCSPAQAQTAHLSGVVNPVGSGFSAPYSVAVDASGDVFVADTSNSAVKEIVAVNGVVSSSSSILTVGGGFKAPKGVALDGSGNIYIADTGNNAVKQMPAGCAAASCVTTLGGGFSGPGGVAVDGSGNVFVADTNNRDVKQMPAGCASSGCVTRLGGGGGGFAFAFTSPYSVAVDATGNIYVADYGANAVKTMPSGCGRPYCVTTLAGGFNQPAGVAVDASGNLFVADSGNNAVKKMRPSCTTADFNNSTCVVTTLGGSYEQPSGMAVDGIGNVFVADTGNSSVMEIVVQGRFSSTAVGSTSSAISLPFTFDTGGMIGAPAVLTQGAKNLDFTDAGTGTCTTNGTTHNYNAGDTCTVDVLFKPAHPGVRLGGVELTTTGGAVIANAFVSGTGTGPQVAFPSNNIPSPVNGSGDFPGPLGMAFDGSGNLFVATIWSPFTVYEIPRGCATYSCVTSLGGNFGGQLTGLAVDGVGNIVVADLSSGGVEEMPPGCASPSCVTLLGNYGASAVAIDGSDNIFIDSGSVVIEIPAGCANASCLISLGGGFIDPFGIAVDGSDNVFVTDIYGVYQVPLGCTSSACVTTLSSGYAERNSIVVDASGNLFVSDGAIHVIPPGCRAASCVTTLSNGFNLAAGLALDGTGNLFVGDAGDNSVKKLDFSDRPSLNFATTPVGASSSDSPQTVTIQNDGNAALVLAGLSYPIDFPMASSDNNACMDATSLSPAQQCDLPIDFAPLSAGNLTEYLTIIDNSLNLANAMQSIQLSGTASSIVWPAPAAITYGTPLSNTQLDATASVAGTFAYSPAIGTVLPVGTQTLSVTFTPAITSGNATVTATVQLTVNAALLTVQTPPVPPGMPSFSVSYGNDAPNLSGRYVITGFVNGDKASVVSGAPALTPHWGTDPNVGTYPVAVGVGTLSAANYTFAAVNGTITVVPAVLTVKPQGKSIEYGDAIPTLEFTAVGLKYGQTASVLSGVPVLTTTATAQSGVGSYPISINVSGVTAANYTLVPGVDAAFTVRPATLVARAINTVLKSGEPIPALTYRITGFVNGDTSSVVSGAATLATTATQGSQPGNYPITFSGEGLSAANYNFVYTNAMLTIEQ